MPDATLPAPPLPDTVLVACPACGGLNPPHAVFCAHCDKALGEFDYVGEAVTRATGWHEALAERITGFIGKPHFFVTHLLWFVAWAMLNTGAILMVRRFDAYPFSLLGILLSAEAILLSGFILVSQNRQSRFARADARLDYEVNVRSYRELVATRALLEDALRRLDALEQRQTPP